MPILERANASLFINISGLDCIGSSSLFFDHRHVDVHFFFHCINCSEYIKVIQYITHDNCFHLRKIISATFASQRPDKSHWLIDGNSFNLASSDNECTLSNELHIAVSNVVIKIACDKDNLEQLDKINSAFEKPKTTKDTK
ncbi:unnamed protein product [Rotaria sp. Silwood2]|nr:unnamed protein product [Rotaria sp. Silwood2]